MDETALRDVESWRDRIEVRLDNRQVFFLFFGSAMVACMLFVLGVIVGKRLESRGRALAPIVEDPLATLDRFGAERGGAVAAPSALTFPRALLGGGSSAVTPSHVAKTEKKVEDKRGEERAEHTEHAERAEHVPNKVSPPPRAEPAPLPPTPAAAVAQAGPEEGVTANRKLAALPRPLGAPGSAAPRSPTSGSHEAVAAKVPAPAVAAKTAPPVVAVTPRVPTPASTTKVSGPPPPTSPKPVLVATAQGAKPVTLTSAKPVSPALARSAAATPAPKSPSAPATAPPAKTAAVASPVKTPAVAAAPAPSPKATAASAAGAASARKGFLLQLSSFPDRSEADAFARRFASENAYVVSTEVPGKGTVYRVRVGSYASLKEAAAAKTNFEQTHNVIAYVAGTGPAQ